MIKLYTVNCDGAAVLGLDTLPEGCQGWVANADTAADARREAKLSGWSITVMGSDPDLCPSCIRKVVADIAPAGGSR